MKATAPREGLGSGAADDGGHGERGALRKTRSPAVPFSAVSASSVVTAVVFLAGACLPARAGDAPAETPLPREEMAKLFAALNSASAAAGTFQARMTRVEETSFLDDVLAYEGEIRIARPDRFRQELSDPKTKRLKSVTVVSAAELWVYFPEMREAQHVDLTKGVKGRAETSAEAIMPWLTFDLAGLEKTYSVRAFGVPVPEGVTLRVVPEERRAGITKREIDALPRTAPAACFAVEFRPLKQASAPAVASLQLWVDGRNPWPLRIRQESPEGDVVTTAFADILLDGAVEAGDFEFRPPRGTRVQELSR